MAKRGLLLALVALAIAVFTQAASADPTNGKTSLTVTAICDSQQVLLSVNGNGEFTPAHVIGGTSVLVPTAFDLTFSFAVTGGPSGSEHDTSAKLNQAKAAVTCDIPAELNTFTNPDGTFVLSGTVTGFFTPANG